VALQTSGGLNGFIDLLATQNKATILAEPNLVAMSGETASFLAGGEIPVITPSAGLTGSTISVIYKQIGVSLAFTPTIVGDRINLKVNPEVSQISTTGAISVPLTATAVVSIPALDTRRASTTVELGSGQSFAIAGLMQQNSTQTVQKIPWLGDVPVLGTLFKSDAYQRSESELVIVVTPYFVEPSNEPLRTPLSGMVPPTDADRLLYQRLNHPTPPTTIPAGTGGPQAAAPTAAAGFKLN
jgi:Flp pilus assembly secretin CpaC